MLRLIFAHNTLTALDLGRGARLGGEGHHPPKEPNQITVMDFPDFRGYGPALAFVTAAIVYKLFVNFRENRKELALGTVVPYKRRHKVEPTHRQRLQLAPVEATMADASLNFHGAMRITVVTLFSGPVPEDATLRGALDRLSMSHPFLRCVLKQERVGFQNVWFAEMDENLKLPFERIHQKHVNLEQAWRIVWEGHEKTPLKLGKPLARLDVITAGEALPAFQPDEPPPTFAVLLSCEHCISDGVSLSVLSHELFTALADELAGKPYQPVKQYWAPAMEEACTPKGWLAPLRYLYRLALFFTFPMPKNATSFPVADRSLLPKDLSLRSSTRKQYADLSTNATARLLLACHGKHTTVTGALSAAALRALAVVIKASPRAQPVPANNPKLCLTYFADVRHHIHPNVSPSCLCYNVSLMPPFISTYNLDDPHAMEADTMWTLSRRVRSSIERGFRAEYMQLAGSQMGVVMNAVMNDASMGNLTATACISNAGLCPVSEMYGPWKLLRVRPTIAEAFSRYPTVLVETAAGHLTITILSPRMYIADEDADLFMVEMLKAIGELIGSHKITKSADDLTSVLDV